MDHDGPASASSLWHVTTIIIQAAMCSAKQALEHGLDLASPSGTLVGFVALAGSNARNGRKNELR